MTKHICEYGTDPATHICRFSGDILCKAHAQEHMLPGQKFRETYSKLTRRTLEKYGAKE